MASGATYNVTRFTRQVLKRHRRAPPSVVVHLYPNHFRFEHQHGNFGYDSPMKCFLEAIREQKLPTDLLDVLDHSNVTYYDGCLIVEVHDHRSYSSSSAASSAPASTSQAALSLATLPPSRLFTFSITPSHQPNSAYNQKAEVYRIVLAPNPATLWTELGILSNRFELEHEDGVGFSQEQAIKMESIILNRTVPPLCLDPSLQTNRIANSMLRATTLRPPKRKRFCGSGECDEKQQQLDDEDDEVIDQQDEEAEPSKRERDQHEKLMRVGDEGISKLKGAAFSRLAFIQAYRDRQSNPHAQTNASGSAAGVPLKAQPGSAVTSIRLGSSQQQQRSQSPAVSSVSSQQQRSHKAKRSSMTGAATAELSDGAASTSSTVTGVGGLTAQQKKQRKLLAAQQQQQQLGMSGTLEEQQQMQQAALEKKRLNAAKKKEKKRLAELAAAQAAAQQGGVDLSTSQAKFTWSGSPQ
ncbi:Spt20p [Sporobolomyces koalae]|uniref:Spt20p n=1 Tax=Sporobolomyces koalae TaxID=500713 RepID=UPI00316B8780